MIRWSILAGTVFAWLGILAVTPVIMTTISSIENTRNSIGILERFIASNEATITSVGTILLIAAFGLITTELSNRSAEMREEFSSRSAEKREAENRRISSELKLAEFRQSWINTLRDTLSEFQAIAMSPGNSPINDQNFYRLGTKIELLMNPHDERYPDLQNIMYQLLMVSEGDILEKYRLNPVFIEVSQGILKTEWEKLKQELTKSRASAP